jgi:DNA-binding beta-propeller fold protein YncE
VVERIGEGGMSVVYQARDTKPARFARKWARWLAAAAVITNAIVLTVPAQTASSCNAPAPEPIVHVAVTGNPFQALPTADGCWAFVSLSGTPESSPQIALLKRARGSISVVREFKIPSGHGNPTGMALTQDGKVLAVTTGPGVLFFDVGRFIAGAADALSGYWHDDVGTAGRVYANISSDDRYLFVSDEGAQAITVLDLAAARKNGFEHAKAIGKIPVGLHPVALTFSRDGKYLYTTSQNMANFGWPIECKPANASSLAAAPDHPQGAVLVIDVARAAKDPATSVVSTIKAGCNPVRLVINPSGNRAYVSARTDNALLVFDTRRFISDAPHALLATVPTGTAPVGVAVINDGRRILVTNSNRWNSTPDDRQTLTVIDAARVTEGARAVLGSVPAGAFPREMRVTADGRTLFLTNFNSHTVDVIDLARLPLTSTAR